MNSTLFDPFKRKMSYWIFIPRDKKKNTKNYIMIVKQICIACRKCPKSGLECLLSARSAAKRQDVSEMWTHLQAIGTFVKATNVTTRTNATLANKCNKSTTSVTTFDLFWLATNVTNLVRMTIFVPWIKTSEYSECYSIS